MQDVGSATAAAASFGIKGLNSVSSSQVAQAFARYYNAHGGIAGRRLDMIEYTLNPTSSSADSDLQAACASFTQDHHVNIVLGQPNAYGSAGFERCLTKAGVVNLENSSNSYDAQSYRDNPRLYSLYGPTVTRRETAMFTELSRTGILSPSTPIGVIVEACPENQRAYTDTVAPLAARLHLQLIRRDVDCTTDYGSVGTMQSQVQASVLPFRSAGVTRVAFVADGEAAQLLSFVKQASSQGYSPLYALTGNAATAILAANYTSAELSQMYGVGWMPQSDTTATYSTPATGRCTQMAASEGISATNKADQWLIEQTCDQFAVFAAAVTAAGGRDDPASVLAALPTIDSSFVSAMQLGGKTHIGGTQHDTTINFAPFHYLTSCACFQYTGPPKALD